jgi:RNA polymerase sigma-70 factor (ECF subfamily)
VRAAHVGLVMLVAETAPGFPSGDSARVSFDDERLVARVRAGDDDAFATLVRRHAPALLRVARRYVPSDVAEDVVQETWIGVLRGLARFEGRSPFKAWLFRILVNRAKTWGVREHRAVPFASVDSGDGKGGRTADPALFLREGAWASLPRRWQDDPEAALRSREARRIVEEAVDVLPERQRIAITLRDLKGLGTDEVSNVLDVSETNQRVLLHRARVKVRPALKAWIDAA